ncbi:MAG TPA: prepilin-type N-terminal cleavage/methylation domain-containing protein, partial [Lachnospiraceae bacterium]|nr:prepilin-type N-terminal cleavage/methylation domain-containing protein [Lachnospiraceae bacterium]
LKEMKEKVRKNNKGFSLVELIIVIAIMAILVGIIGSQLVPYLERSRAGRDRATLDTIYTAYSTALAENEVTSPRTSDGLDAQTDKTGDSIRTLLGASLDLDSEINKRFSSNAAGTDNVQFTYTPSTGLIQVKKGSITVNNQ